MEETVISPGKTPETQFLSSECKQEEIKEAVTELSQDITMLTENEISDGQTRSETSPSQEQRTDSLTSPSVFVTDPACSTSNLIGNHQLVSVGDRSLQTQKTTIVKNKDIHPNLVPLCIDNSSQELRPNDVTIESCTVLTEIDHANTQYLLSEPQDHQLEIEICDSDLMYTVPAGSGTTELQEFFSCEHNYATSISINEEASNDTEVKQTHEAINEAVHEKIDSIQSDNDAQLPATVHGNNAHDHGHFTDDSADEQNWNRSDQNINPVQVPTGIKTCQVIPGMMAYRNDDSSDMASDTSESSTSSDESSSVNLPVIADDSDSNSDHEDGTGRRSKKQANKFQLKTRGEMSLADLPPIEDLAITVDDNVEMVEVGAVSCIVDALVIVQANKDTPALNMDTILFLEDRKVLGQVFETFGPVAMPLYSVRYNSKDQIEERGIKPGVLVCFAPRADEFTHYVFMEHLRKLKGSDASWEYNNEPPNQYIEYSDDEQETKAKTTRKKERRQRNDKDEESSECPNKIKVIRNSLENREPRTKQTTSTDREHQHDVINTHVWPPKSRFPHSSQRTRGSKQRCPSQPVRYSQGNPNSYGPVSAPSSTPPRISFRQARPFLNSPSQGSSWPPPPENSQLGPFPFTNPSHGGYEHSNEYSSQNGPNSFLNQDSNHTNEYGRNMQCGNNQIWNQNQNQNHSSGPQTGPIFSSRGVPHQNQRFGPIGQPVRGTFNDSRPVHQQSASHVPSSRSQNFSGPPPPHHSPMSMPLHPRFGTHQFPASNNGAGPHGPFSRPPPSQTPPRSFPPFNH